MTRPKLPLALLLSAALATSCTTTSTPEQERQPGAVKQSAVAPALGTTASFAVLAGSTVTNTGSTVVTGDLGVSPGSAVTGFPPGVVLAGTIHSNDAVAIQAQTDATTAYNALAGQACDTNLTGQDLGGMTLTPGTYCFSSSAQLTGTLTLNAQGNPAAVFIFQIGSTLTTASSSSVVMINGGNSCNVFWQVGSSGTFGTGTAFLGNIIALSSITFTTGANHSGRALARNGAVTLDTSSVNAGACNVAPVVDAGTPGVDAGTVIPVDAGAGGSGGHGGGNGGGIGGGQGGGSPDPVDAGPVYVDAGPAYIDAGQPYMDAGYECEDAGTIDLQTDNNNCGFLGNTCLADQTCTHGVCLCVE